MTYMLLLNCALKLVEEIILNDKCLRMDMDKTKEYKKSVILLA